LMRVTFDTNSIMDLFEPRPTQRPTLRPPEFRSLGEEARVSTGAHAERAA
jgi:hypothetical protein